MGDSIGITLFGIFAFSFIGGSIFEYYGASNFINKLYFLGVKVINIQEQWGEFQLQKSDRIKETESGKYKIIDEGTILFRYNQPLISFRVNTPLPLKGVVRLDNGKAFIMARTPIAPAVFMSVWLLGWTAGGIGVLVQGQGQVLQKLMFVSIGWLFFGGMIAYAYKLEKKRLLIVLNEIKQKLNVYDTGLSDRAVESSRLFEIKHLIIFVALIVGVISTTHYFFEKSASDHILKASNPQELRLSDYEQAFFAGKNQELMNKLIVEYTENCKRHSDYNCRLLGYIYEVNKDQEAAHSSYKLSCSDKDPQSCYNVFISKKSTQDEIQNADQILKNACSTNGQKFKTCCDCYYKAKNDK